MVRAAWGGVFAFGLLFASAASTSAFAAAPDTAPFQGNWVNDASRTVLNALGASDNEDVARIVVSAEGKSRLRIHLYGRCGGLCDWGSALGHPYTDAASSDMVRAIRADFQTSSGIKHLTLRPGSRSALRFELVTDFTDRSGRHDYETAGSLRLDNAPPPPEKPAPAPVVVAHPSGAAQAAVALSPAPHHVAEPQPARDEDEDCVKVYPPDVIATPTARGTVVKDFLHTLINFEADKLAAAKTVQVIRQYRFDEMCGIGRGKAKFSYWRVAGQFPKTAIAGADCVEIQPDAITAQGGKVLAGSRVIADFDGDSASAVKAVQLLRSNKVNRQCFAARPNEKMVYWLAR